MAIMPEYSTLEDLFGTMGEDVADTPQEPLSDEAPPVHLSPEQERRLLRQLQDHYTEAITHREQLTQQRATNYRRFLADATLRDRRQLWEYAKEIFLPVTRSTVEDLQTRHAKHLGRLEAIEVGGIGEEDRPTAQAKTLFTRYALREINPTHWTHLVRDTQQDALLDKLAILKIYPYAFPFPVPTEEGRFLQQYIRMDALDIGTVGIPPQATGLQWPECAYLFHQLYVPLQEFPSMRQRGFELPAQDVLERWAETLGTTQLQDDERLLLDFQRSGWDPSAVVGGTLELVESYELFDLGGPREEFLVVSWFPKLGAMDTGTWQAGKLSRVKRLSELFHQTVFPRPMWPFFPIRCWRQPRSLWGMSAVERMEQEQDLLNRSAEQMIEEGDFNIAPRVFANLATTGDLPNLRHTEPGEVIPVDAMGQVWFAPQSNQNRHYLERMGLIRTWLEENMKLSAYSQGRAPLQPNTPRTLGGQTLILQQGDEAHESQVLSLVLDYTAALKFYVGLWQHRFPDRVLVPTEEPDPQALEQRVFGGVSGAGSTRLVPVRHADMAGMLDLKIKVNPNALADQQKMLAMAQHMDTLLQGRWPLGRRKLWKDVWEALELQGFDELYPEEVAVVETLLLVLQAQAQIGQLEMGLMQMGQQPGLVQLPGGGLVLPEAPASPGFATAPPGGGGMGMGMGMGMGATPPGSGLEPGSPIQGLLGTLLGRGGQPPPSPPMMPGGLSNG